VEADWSAEVGTDLPRISIPWDGFLNLRQDQGLIAHLDDARSWPALGNALAGLNARESRVITSKCDAWKVAADEIDPREFDAAGSKALTGFASYFDVCLVDPAAFASFATNESWARRAVTELRRFPCQCARVELVIRGADMDGLDGFGMTAYATGCGANEVEATANWVRALGALVEVLAVGASDATMI
jgi:hypothetical protein